MTLGLSRGSGRFVLVLCLLDVEWPPARSLPQEGDSGEGPRPGWVLTEIASCGYSHLEIQISFENLSYISVYF